MISSDDLSMIENYNRIQIVSEKAFHDFKNILATISGIAQLTMMKTLPEDVRSNLYSINQATFELRDSIQRYYDFTLDYNNQRLSACLIYESISTVLNIVKYKFDIQKMIKKAINLNFEINSNSRVLCNEYELRQCFLNIIMNALESMERDGGNLYIGVTEDSKCTYVEIIDSGTGISQENLDRLFQETFTTKVKGTGLGLKIAKNTIEKFGGNIQITSQQGIGTKVKISLPLYKECNKG